MNIWERIQSVQRMQDYIHEHINGRISLEDLSRAAGYSKWHSLRIFKEAFHKTPFEYIRVLQLTNAAKRIRTNSDDTILDIALNSGFDSHEGFTKAFTSYFGINPSKYSSHVPRRYMYFEPTSILQYYILLNAKERKAMEGTPRTITVTVIEKPKCKLILKRGIKSTDYFAYCEEIGCDAWEILETVPQSLDKVVFILLPPHMITAGTSKAACAVEVPHDFCSDIPKGFEIIDLPAHLMMWFQGSPYEDESWFGESHSEIYRAIDNYKPELYGYEFAMDSAPRFEYGTSAATGCRVIIPVKRL